MTTVTCYLYDISGGMARGMSAMMLGQHIDAVYHTGVVAYGIEYFFDGGVGIEKGAPGRTRFGTPLRKVQLGTTAKSKEEFEAWNLQEGRSGRFSGNAYHVLRNNCNHYTDAAGKFLCGVGAPHEVMNQVEVFLSTPMGKMLQPMIEQMMSGFQPPPPPPPSSSLLPPPAALEALVNKAGEGGLEALRTIKKVLENVRNHPNEEKYRSLRLGNEKVREQLGKHGEAVEVLKGMGFAAAEDVLRHSGPVPSQAAVDAVTAAVAEAEEMKRILALSEEPHEVEPPQPVWMPWKGNPPQACEPAGHEKDSACLLYPARNRAKQTAGKVGRHLGGEAHLVGVTKGLVKDISTEVEMLVLHKGAHRWVPCSGDVAKADLKGTVEAFPGAYVARAVHEGGVHPGFAVSGTPGCTLPFASSAVTVASFDLLVLDGTAERIVPTLTRETCNPLHTLDDLLAFSSSVAVPRPRPNLLKAPQFCYIRDPGVPRVAVCHDMDGNYTTADRDPLGVRGEDADCFYRFRHWELADCFIYFSHALVSIPTFGWVNAAHTFGVPCLGTFIAEGQNGAAALSRILSSPHAVVAAASALAEVQAAYQFDGWLLNIEVNVPPQLLDNLHLFVQEVTQRAHLASPAGKVLWYDSVSSETGRVDYQNGVTFKNLEFFSECDGLFTNYWWNEDTPRGSAELAGDRAGDVYHGVDVFGRNTYGGGGLNTVKAFPPVSAAGVSAAVFAPCWPWHGIRTDRKRFEARDDELWDPVKAACSASGTIRGCLRSLPFWTDFSTGCGESFYVSGRLASSTKWFDLSTASPAPPFLPKTSPTGVKASCKGRAYHKGNALLLEFPGNAPLGVFELFEVKLPPGQGQLSVEMVTRGAPLGLLLVTGSGEKCVLQPTAGEGSRGTLPTFPDPQPLDGWRRLRWEGQPRDIVTISVVFVSTVQGPSAGEIGSLSLVSGTFPAPQPVPSPEPRCEGNDFRLTWQQPPEAHYDIFQGNEYLGRCHGSVFTGTLSDGSRRELRLEGTDATGQPLLPLTLALPEP